MQDKETHIKTKQHNVYQHITKGYEITYDKTTQHVTKI